MSAESLYDFETAMENAFAFAMRDAGLTVATPRDFATYELSRPRVDLMFQSGPAKQSFHLVNDVRRNAAWSGTLNLVVVCDGEGWGSVAHRTYRAKVREVMATMLGCINSLNDTNDAKLYLPHHTVNNIVDMGTVQQVKATEGIEESQMQYAIEFGITHSAWAELTT